MPIVNFVIRHAKVLVGVIVILCVVGKAGRYFFDSSTPVLTMRGLESDGCYCSDMQCGVSSSKSGELSIWLDGQPLLSKFTLNARNYEHPFAIPTRTISNGKHSLKVELADFTYRQNKAVAAYDFYVDNVPLQAAFVRPDSENKVFQGRTLHIQFQANKEIKHAHVRTLSNRYDCFQESPNSLIYECFVPVACEENPNEYLLSIDIADHVGNTLTLDSKFQVVLYPFKQQKIQVGAEKLKEEKEIGLPSAGREKVFADLTAKSPKQKLWRGTFCLPIDVARITCDFGTVRTTQEKGRYVHKALDLINLPRSVVWATQAGVIVLKDRYEDTGNTIIIDHGCGVLSMFYHLEDFANVEVGQKIAQGNPIGTIGKTGYATGYHLHWEMRLNNIAVDPMQWTKPTF